MEDAELVVRYPEMDAPAGIVTVPVKVGEASGASPRADAVLFSYNPVAEL